MSDIRDLLAAYDDATHARAEAALREDPPFDREMPASEKFTHPIFQAEGATRDAIISAFEELQAKAPEPLNARDYLIHLTGRVAMSAEDVGRVWEIARGLRGTP